MVPNSDSLLHGATVNIFYRKNQSEPKHNQITLSFFGIKKFSSASAPNDQPTTLFFAKLEANLW